MISYIQQTLLSADTMFQIPLTCHTIFVAVNKKGNAFINELLCLT